MRMAIAASLLLLMMPLPADAQEAAAAGASPSEASIRELIEVTGASRMVEDMYGRIDSMMRQSMQEAMAGQQLTPGQERLIDEMRERIIAIFQDEMNWQKMEPMMIDIYRRSFTQDEIDGMRDFYRTDAGRAVIAKMPLVMEHTMAAMQQHMRTMLPRLREVQEDIVARMRQTALQPPAGP